jgi:hypothetical protein
MPAYNPPPQVLFSPATNYYQGKAIRLQQEMQQKELDSYDKKMDLEERRVAATEQNAQTQADLLEQRQTEWRREAGEANYKRLTLHANSVVDTIDSLYQNTNKTPEDQMAVLEESLPLFSDYIEAVSEVSPNRGAEAAKILEDRVITPEEYQGFRRLVKASASEFIEPKKPPTPSELTKLQARLNDPNTPDQDKPAIMARIRKITETSPLVSINMGGQGAATEKYGGTVGERAGERDEQAQATYANDAELSRIALALANGARTGFGESIILDIRNAFETFGGISLPEGAQESEIVRSIGNKLALMLRNPDSGLGLTGNTSNKDLQFLKDSVAGIGRSEGGNRLMIKQAMKLNQFKRDIADEQARIIAEKTDDKEAGVVPLDLDAQLMRYANGYEMYTNQERKEIRDFLKNGPTSDLAEDASDEEILEALGLR